MRELENNFSVNKNCTPVVRAKLARSLKLDPAKVMVWFQNRKAKEKNEKKREMQRKVLTRGVDKKKEKK